MLYIVPTPIGNLDDMTPRAIEVLQSVSLIIAEDTRTSGKLLKHFGITTPSQSYHSFNEHKVVSHYAERLESGEDIALISDAGTPGISDPGYLVAKAAHEVGAKVSCLPGATAFVPALAASGLPASRFYFEGFLPHKKGRQSRWKYLQTLDDTIVLYESPFRVVKCLKEIVEYFSEDHLICVCREISKMFEEIKRGRAIDVFEFYNSQQKVKGEIVIIISQQIEKALPEG